MADPTNPAETQPIGQVESVSNPARPEGADAVVEHANMLAEIFSGFLTRLQNPWTLYQFGIIFAIGVIAYCLKLALRPRIRKSIADGGFSKLTLRFFAVIVQRLDLIFFSLIAWVTYFTMQAATWPSRSYFIQIAASIATAWLVIAVVTRLIKNNFMRSFLRFIGWTYAALAISGLWDNVSGILDSIAYQSIEYSSTNGEEGFHISLLMILVAIVSLAILFLVAGFLTRTTSNRLEASTDISPSIKVLLKKVSQIAFYGAAFFIGLKSIGFDLSNLALLTGAIGLGLGFGLQKIVSNLVSGVIILLDKSIKPGDVISLGETFGWITSLGARYASITTRDGREYLVPNEDFITSQVINWTHSSDFVRLDIHFGVSYDSDPHEVKRIATEAPKTVSRVVSSPAPVCHIINFGDSSIDFKLRFWIKDPTAGLTNIRGNVYLALWDALKENNIDIPFPRRDVHMYQDVLPND